MEQDEHIAELFRKYLADDYTRVELEEILQYFSHPADESQLDELVVQELGRLSAIDADRQALVDSISATVERSVFSQTRPGLWHRYRWLPYAAAVLLVASIAGWLIIGNRWSVFGEQQLAATEIQPGGNKATLTLATGRVVTLDEAQTGIIVNDQGITYSDGASLGVPPADTLLLTTPKGGTYQVSLADGSKVWLNSASTLKYPSRFPAGERVVEILGEGYFEIAKDTNRPFKVVSAGQTVEVLGTAFNITAYADESETKTTLVEGSVRVSGVASAQNPNDSPQAAPAPEISSVTISPGQQATKRGAQIETRQVDVEQYTSWKDGYFTLKGTIPQILANISRWYNVEVAYHGAHTDSIGVLVTFPRDRPLTQVLAALQRADRGLDYRIEQQNVKQDGGDAKPERRLTIFRKVD